MRTEAEQRGGTWRRALRARYVAPALILVLAVLWLGGGEDMSICGCTPPWFLDDPDALVP